MGASELVVTLLILGALVLTGYMTDKSDKRRKEEGRK